MRTRLVTILLLILLPPISVLAQQVKLLEQKPDPHGFPRPARDAKHVPLATSLYLELRVETKEKPDSVQPESVTAMLESQSEESVDMLKPGQHFAEGYSGWLKPKQDLQGATSLAVYIDPEKPLRPATTYTVRVKARSKSGAELPKDQGAWSFTTEEAPTARAVAMPLDLKAEPVRWRGGFFTGFGNVLFCTSAATFGPTYDLMAESRKRHPRAWSYQRDFWMTGTEQPASFVPVNLPNAVRERETRRITAIDQSDGSTRLRIEDVFGHQQYGIPSGRPLADDYHPGDEVLVSDTAHEARAKVVAVDERARTVMVSAIAAPAGGWKLAYTAPLPTKEDPDAPGLFAAGGCYLRKLNPVGTPCYFWGRLNKEWDLAHRHYGRRLLPNFADAPADLARDGRSWTTVKDLAEWHEVARNIAGHIIDRYGKDSLQFTWSIFNEPDLLGVFWRADWNDLQAYYDVTVDAVLRAFEDRGFDSKRVFIGGLELGGIFGTNLKLREFLAHCSPRAQAKGAVPRNAAVADRRLDGKRSKRVEELCRAHGGKGAPCDFVSIHSYNRAEMMAAKLIRAKEEALAIDPEYYRALWVNSHESCPDWLPPPDTAAADSYLGNGYFPTWCVDVARRQLRQAANDPRFAFGETILTVWAPNANFAGLNAVTRAIQCDDDGDGVADRSVTVPMPIFHVLELLSDMGDRYWVLPDRTVGGHTVSGFASRDEKAVRVLLYAHNAEDTQSRSEAEFDVEVDLAGLDGRRARVQEYHFDKDHNSYFRLGRTLRDHPPAHRAPPPGALDEAVRGLDQPESRRRSLEALARLGPNAQPALPAILKLMAQPIDEAVRAAAQEALKRIMAPIAYPRADVDKVRALAELRPTGSSTSDLDAGRLRLTARVAGNGLNIVVIEPEPQPSVRTR